MRRLLVTFCLVWLVLASLAVGVLAADWPFWQRAWHWHAAPSGYPDHVPGSWLGLGRGAGSALPEAEPASPEGAALLQLAAKYATQALLVTRGDTTLAQYYGVGVNADTLLQGRGLTELILAPLYGVARLTGRDLLDKPLAALLPDRHVAAAGFGGGCDGPRREDGRVHRATIAVPATGRGRRGACSRAARSFSRNCAALTK